MKLIKLMFWSGIISVSLFCISCTKDDDENEDKLPEGQIVMKITPNWNNNVYFELIAQTVTVDWGDGNIESLTPQDGWIALWHEYANRNIKTVTMKTSGLTYLDVGINHSGIIYELSLGKCPKLSYLDCLNNQLTNLDVSKNTALTELRCYYNQITSLDVSKNTALALLYCHHNQITSLDVSKNIALIELRCFNNQLTATALNTLFNSLPIKTPPVYSFMYISNNPGADACDKSIAENRGWRVF